MKKILTFALVAAAISSQAVSFTWNSNSVKISFDGSTALAEAGKITAALIYLGTDSSATVNGYDVDNGIVVQTKDTTSSGMAATKGTYSQKYTKVLGTTFENNATFAAGDYFTVLLTYTDSNDVKWYNLSSTVYQLPEDATDQTNDLKGSFNHSFSMNAKGTALSAGGGWTAVPEPSTAALALAGLALLLKRRKA